MTARRAIAFLAVVLLAGCGSSPKTHYFTLDASKVGANGKVTIATPVTVAALHLPPSLDRREIVRRTGATTVQIDDQNRWAAPLGELARRTFSQDLAEHLPKDKVILPDSPAPPRTAQIVVSLAQFGSNAQGRVTLDGSWSLLEGGSGKLITSRTVTLESAAPANGPGGEAAAMSDLLGQLAAQIAEDLPRKI